MEALQFATVEGQFCGTITTENEVFSYYPLSSIAERLVVCSPVLAEKKALEGMGKKLKKNNVALDIVSFGEDDGEKVEKLEALLNAVNSNDNSHIVHIPGGDALSDVLIR